MRIAATLLASAPQPCSRRRRPEPARRRIPLRLVLQRSDFPAKTRLTSARYPSIDKALAAAGFQAKSADYRGEVPLGSTETLHVSGRVVVLREH